MTLDVMPVENWDGGRCCDSARDSVGHKCSLHLNRNTFQSNTEQERSSQ